VRNSIAVCAVATTNHKLVLSHIDIFFQVTIEVGRGEVNGTKFEIMLSSQSKDDAEGDRFEGGGEEFVVVNAMALATTICNKSGLIVLN
jgi:hypothetical protein